MQTSGKPYQIRVKHTLRSPQAARLVLAPGQRCDLNGQRLDVLVVAYLEGVSSEGDVARLVVGPAVIA